VYKLTWLGAKKNSSLRKRKERQSLGRWMFFVVGYDFVPGSWKLRIQNLGWEIWKTVLLPVSWTS